MPIITFSILIGLNMDYDVFLVTGILSARSSGLSNRAAIVAGLENNGTVIGVAGLIMAAAFSGLLFSHTVANQQLGAATPRRGRAPRRAAPPLTPSAPPLFLLHRPRDPHRHHL